MVVPTKISPVMVTDTGNGPLARKISKVPNNKSKAVKGIEGACPSCKVAV